MRREGLVGIRGSQREADEYREYGANGMYKSLAKFYNTKIATNRTVKQPYGCPKGRRHCAYCSHYMHSGKHRRCLLKEEMREISEY